MKYSVRRSWLLILAAVALAVFAQVPSATAQRLVTGTTRVTMQRVGSPAWTPVDLHVFSAPVGTGADGFAEFGQTIAALLPPPHYQVYPGIGLGPGAPELPPYDHDLASGIKQAGYPEGSVFGPTEFSHGTGVYLAFMVVPSSGSTNVGSSPDFARGPIIPNSLFPINTLGVTSRDTAVYDPSLASIQVPALSDPVWNGAFNVDGFSHFPIFVADNNEAAGQVATRLPGLYAFKLTMRDASGSGWNISASFVIT